MHLIRSFLTLTCVTSVLANPSWCGRPDACLSVLHGPLQPMAVSFCQSYLGVNTVTSTTTTQVTGTGKIVTVTLPDQTATATAETTVTVTVTDVVATVNIPGPTIILRRDRKAMRTAAKAAPSQLGIFAASRISSACSCIVTPGSTTKIVTVTNTVPGPAITQTQSGNIDTITSTETITDTIVDSTTETITGPTVTI